MRTTALLASGVAAVLAAVLPAAGQVDGPIPSELARRPRAMVEANQPVAAAHPSLIDPNQSDTYTCGPWTYVYKIRLRGTRSERRNGELYYWTKKLPYPDAKGDHYNTPWGRLHYFGRDSYFSGWLRRERSGKVWGKTLPAPAPGKIDAKQSRTYEWGKWKYVYKVAQAGTPVEGRTGALLYDGKPVLRPKAASPTNDYYETPWGRIYWTGQPNTIQGPHEWMPRLAARTRMGKQLPDPGRPGVPAFEGKKLLIEQASDGKTVSAVVGQRIVIRLPSEGPGPKPPPRWTALLRGEALWQEGEPRLRSRTVVGPPGIVGIQQGGPMHVEVAFVAVRPGKAVVTLLCRPWRQPDAVPSRTFTVTVDVKAGGAGAAAAGLVPGRMVCCEACKARLDLANGVKKCPGCRSRRGWKASA